MQAIREARMLRSRRYTNRHLGEFLKKLDLTEGRATGIPTIQQKLQENGSQRASIETDKERTSFLIDIPCNSECFGVPDMKKCKKELSDIQTFILNNIIWRQQNDYTGFSKKDRTFCKKDFKRTKGFARGFSHSQTRRWT